MQGSITKLPLTSQPRPHFSRQAIMLLRPHPHTRSKHTNFYEMQHSVISKLQKQRYSNSSIFQKNGKAIQIPAPTWSIKDLNLAKPPSSDRPNQITDEELETLAYRCLIDIRTFPPEKVDRLKQGLEQIMRCTSLVCNLNSDGDEQITAEDMYDLPRRDPSYSFETNGGSGKGPGVRTRSMEEEQNGWDRDVDEARCVVDSVREDKMAFLKEGEEDEGQWYFSIVTEKRNSVGTSSEDEEDGRQK